MSNISKESGSEPLYVLKQRLECAIEANGVCECPKCRAHLQKTAEEYDQKASLAGLHSALIDSYVFKGVRSPNEITTGAVRKTSVEKGRVLTRRLSKLIRTKGKVDLGAVELLALTHEPLITQG